MRMEDEKMWWEKEGKGIYPILIIYSSLICYAHIAFGDGISTKIEISIELVRFAVLYYRLPIKYFHQCLLCSISRIVHTILPNHQYKYVSACECVMIDSAHFGFHNNREIASIDWIQSRWLYDRLSPSKNHVGESAKKYNVEWEL